MSQLELWTEQEEVQLQYHEQVIEKGLETFYEVGQSLMFIRENRLYRKEFKTFEEYCQEKWGKSRRWADRFIKGFEVADLLESETPGSEKPTTEKQVRPLTKLETPEQQAEAWSNAVANSETGKPTAKEVDAEVQKLKAQLKEKEAALDNLKRANQHVTSQLQEKANLLEGLEQTYQETAKTLAQKMVEREVAKATQDLRLELTELKAEKLKLENQQAVNKEDLKTAKENYEKALRDFKANPDPETKAKKESLEREAKKAQEQLSTTQADLNRLSLQMESLKTKENHAVSVSITLCAFHKAFKKFMADNSEAMIAMTSPYLDGRQLAEIESLAETLQDWANKVRDSIDNLRSQSSSAIEVEIVDYFPEIEGAS